MPETPIEKGDAEQLIDAFLVVADEFGSDGSLMELCTHVRECAERLGIPTLGEGSSVQEFLNPYPELARIADMIERRGGAHGHTISLEPEPMPPTFSPEKMEYPGGVREDFLGGVRVGLWTLYRVEALLRNGRDGGMSKPFTGDNINSIAQLSLLGAVREGFSPERYVALRHFLYCRQGSVYEEMS